MAGDITRSTFHRAKHYSGVRMQQGRVQMDADWNEQLDIRRHVERTTNLDVIGPCGAPEPATANFAVEVQGGNLLIRQGRIYVDGILCENEQDVLLALPSPAGPTPVQPDLPGIDISSTGALGFDPLLVKLGVPAGFAPLPPTPGVYSAFLDVWERDIIALDDPLIREVALGGPDTATRSKVVWQVKLLSLGESGGPQKCPTDFSEFVSTGLLAARAQPDPGNNNPCAVPAQAGYRRLENQLYRVEIDVGGPAGAATFKWSRDNASVVAGWTGQDGADPDNLFVTTLGKDTELGFSGGQWVELTDDTRELWGIPGTLVRLKTAQVTGQGPTLTIDPSTASPPGPVSRDDFPRNPKVRRWDQAATAAITLVGGAMAVQENVWLDLEDGVQVLFQTGGKYQTGDFWLIPARTATAISTPAVEWPADPATSKPLRLPPAGIRHHFCALALVQFNAGNTWTFLQDCRPMFPPLTNLGTQSSAGCCCTVTVGPQDAATLQTTLNNAAGSAATICLSPGIYPLPAPLVLAAQHSNFTIEGCPGGVTLQAAAGAEQNFLDGLMVLVAANNVTLRGLTFQMPLVPFEAAGGKLAALDPAVLAGVGGPKAQTLQNLLVSVGLRPMECSGLTVEDCNFVYDTSSQGGAAMVVTAADAEANGNNITVAIAVHPGPDAAHSTYDVTVTETDLYIGLNFSTIESILGSDTVAGRTPGLVRVQHAGLTQALPPSGTFQLAGGTATAPASVRIVTPGTELALTLLAKKNGVDGSLTTVLITSNPAGNSFNLQATWTKTVLGATVATTASDLAALAYEVTVAPPPGGAFALPLATQTSPIHLTLGADGPPPLRASATVPAAQPNLFQVGIFAGSTCSGLKVEGNSFGPVGTAFVPPLEIFQEPFRLSLGCVQAPAATIGTITTVIGPIPSVKLTGAAWADSWLDRASFTGNAFSGLAAAALIYGETGAVRVEDNEARNCYAGILISARRTPPAITGDLANLQPQLLAILHDALVQVGVALVLSYPLPAAFTGGSAITPLPPVTLGLFTGVFPTLPLLNAFDVLLQLLFGLQQEAATVILPRGLQRSLLFTGNIIEALMLDSSQNSTGPGLVVWGDESSLGTTVIVTGKVILSANRIENNAPSIPAVTVILVLFAAINGNVIVNNAINSIGFALTQFANLAATGNVLHARTNLQAQWTALNLIE